MIASLRRCIDSSESASAWEVFRFDIRRIDIQSTTPFDVKLFVTLRRRLRDVNPRRGPSKLFAAGRTSRDCRDLAPRSNQRAGRMGVVFPPQQHFPRAFQSLGCCCALGELLEPILKGTCVVLLAIED